MQTKLYIARSGGVAFEDGENSGRVLVSGRDTDGRYSLTEYVAAANALPGPGEEPNFGAHRHNDIEETFLVRSGRLKFLLGDDVIELGPGDFVRVPPGVRHGYANVSGAPVELLVSFYPGGFEELFVRHRSDQPTPPPPLGFVEDAVRQFNSEFEDHPEVR